MPVPRLIPRRAARSAVHRHLASSKSGRMDLSVPSIKAVVSRACSMTPNWLLYTLKYISSQGLRLFASQVTFDFPPTPPKVSWVSVFDLKYKIEARRFGEPSIHCAQNDS